MGGWVVVGTSRGSTTRVWVAGGGRVDMARGVSMSVGRGAGGEGEGCILAMGRGSLCLIDAAAVRARPAGYYAP